MDQERLRTLRLLQALEERDDATQRQLASDLNISLGLLNSCMKTLGQQGYFNTYTKERNRARYLLTPKGRQEKAKLTLEYIQHSVAHYRELKQLLRSLLSRLEAQGVRRLALYGSGDLAELAYFCLLDSDIKFGGVFDQSPAGREFYGHQVQPGKALATADFDCLLVTEARGASGNPGLISIDGVLPDKILYLEEWAGQPNQLNINHGRQ